MLWSSVVFLNRKYIICETTTRRSLFSTFLFVSARGHLIHLQLSLKFFPCYPESYAASLWQEILTLKTGAVKHSPPDKSVHEPSPWSPVWVSWLMPLYLPCKYMTFGVFLLHHATIMVCQVIGNIMSRCPTWCLASSAF